MLVVVHFQERAQHLLVEKQTHQAGTPYRGIIIVVLMLMVHSLQDVFVQIQRNALVIVERVPNTVPLICLNVGPQIKNNGAHTGMLQMKNIVIFVMVGRIQDQRVQVQNHVLLGQQGAQPQVANNKQETLLYAVGAGFVGLWLFDVLTSNLLGRRILHQAGTTTAAPGQVCTSCVPSAGGSFTCMTCATAGTVGAPAYGCTQCAAGATPGTFTCTGCEGYTCTTCTAGTTPGSFTCTGCMDALTAAATGADPCASVTTPCIFDSTVNMCVRTGNSSCTCSGCKVPSSASCSSSNCIYDTSHQECLCKGTTNKCSGCKKPSTSTSKSASAPKTTPAVPGGGSGTVATGQQAAARLNALNPKPSPAPASKPVKVCPPLVKC